MMLRRRRRGALLGAAALVLIATAIVVVLGSAGGSAKLGDEGGAETQPVSPAGASAAPGGAPVEVLVDDTHPGAAVPADFLGLSFEAEALAALTSRATSPELVLLLRSLGSGVLRIGGDSADSAAWSQHAGAPPRWASSETTHAELASLARLARAARWRVLLTVNFGHYDPTAAASEAAAAHALLRGDLAGIEIGNEPDRYVLKGLRASGWNFATYARQFNAYRAAIAAAAPGVPVLAPGASSGIPPLPWVRAAARLRPARLTDHYYPLTKCGGSTVSLGELLGAQARAKEGAMFGRLLAIERASSTSLLLDETNNVSCRGEPGVSNTFAAAVWAADFIARGASAGVRGLDFHNLISSPGSYSPLLLHAGRLYPTPEWYGLLLARAIPGTRALPAYSGSTTVTASAFLGPHHTVRVLLVDFEGPGSAPRLAQLHLNGRYAGGTILRLTGPSPGAIAGAALGGRAVKRSGAWGPRLPLPRVYVHNRTLSLALAPDSAALVTLVQSGQGETLLIR